MSNKSLRKTPAQPEKRRQKKTTNASGQPAAVIPSANWLPGERAGFAAWGEAAERAHREHHIVLKSIEQNRGDAKLRQKREDALALFYYTLERAYPPDFWEGMAALCAGTLKDIEIYIAFLEADLHFFRSGYAKSKIIRGLKRLPLTSSQKKRLQNVVLHVVDKGFRREFRDYARLAWYIQSPKWLQEVETRLSSSDRNLTVRAKWILEACRRKS